MKHILGKNLSLRDLEDIDADLAKNLNWILTNENVEDIGMYFNYEKTVLGEKKVCDLIPDGSNIPITNENKKDFVRKMCEMKMKTEIEPQLNAFLRGFRHIYPLKWMAPFTPLELEILIGGPQKIDISSMRKTVVYKGYKETDTVIVWLWEFLEGLSQVQLSQFLYFLTGNFLNFELIPRVSEG